MKVSAKILTVPALNASQWDVLTCLSRRPLWDEREYASGLEEGFKRL
jgi:hypothetical protein